MDASFADAIMVFVSAGVGAVLRHYLVPKPPPPEPQIIHVERVVQAPAPAPTEPSGPRRKVTFRFADGSEDHKTLFEHSILPTLPWKGRLFEQVTEQDNVLIYHEQVR